MLLRQSEHTYKFNVKVMMQRSRDGRGNRGAD